MAQTEGHEGYTPLQDAEEPVMLSTAPCFPALVPCSQFLSSQQGE